MGTLVSRPHRDDGMSDVCVWMLHGDDVDGPSEWCPDDAELDSDYCAAHQGAEERWCEE